MSSKELGAKVKELRELRRMSAELSKLIGNIEDEIKVELSERNLDEIAGDDWCITWHLVSNRSVDVAALRKVMPEIVEAYTREKTTRRFCVA